MTEKLSIDVWSDVACPWCFLGKKSLEKALDTFEFADDVEVTFHSYELNPDADELSSEPVIDYLVRVKGAPAEKIRESFSMITERGHELGLAYDFDHTHNANTRRAHRLIHFARPHGLDAEVIDALFSAMFEKGVAVGSVDALVEIGVAAGLDASAVRAALDDPAWEQKVAEDVATARQLGIQGVPFFVLDGRYAVSGAQSVDAFSQVLEQVWTAKESVDA